MKILIQILLMFNICFLIAELQISKLNVTNSTANVMPTNYYGASFINTDGMRKWCTSHVDCYDVREPIYWCRLAQNQQWTDKGCYCDPILKACIIERITRLGPTTTIRNYAYCTKQAYWRCPPFRNL